MHHIFIIQPSTQVHLGCFLLLSIAFFKIFYLLFENSLYICNSFFLYNQPQTTSLQLPTPQDHKHILLPTSFVLLFLLILVLSLSLL